MKVLLLTALLLVVTVFAKDDHHEHPYGYGHEGQRVEVTAKSGPIIGETLTAEYRSIARFLGVPYAKVPRRFRRSVPVQRWTSPHEALHWAPNCFQNAEHPFNAYTQALMLTNEMTEDCLHLNIWSPAVKEAEEGKLRPVIVWFHGGALLLGTPAMRWYEGETLAARADAVVVTVNYRYVLKKSGYFILILFCCTLQTFSTWLLVLRRSR